MNTQNQMVELNEQELEQVNGACGGYYYYPYPKEIRYDEKHLNIHEQTAYSSYDLQYDSYSYVVKY
jgi:hypothetical protein